MKKILFTFISIFALCSNFNSQTNTATPSEINPDFDKKFRFGIRATPQPSWYKSDNNNSKGAGATFGFGFGLIMEFKLSKIIHFTTGIGGDFEGGYVSYRKDNDFAVNALLNSEGQYVESKEGKFASDVQLANGNTQVILKDRKYNTTFISIPLLLKMMTEEYSGARYFAMFGGELGIRAGVKGTDTYVSGFKSTVTGSNTTIAAVPEGDLTKTNINLGSDASLVPLRIGMNLGMGTEYRLGGSTALVFSLNYFQSFTNLMKKESENLIKVTSAASDPLNQSYLMRAVRINIGLLF